LRESLGKSGTPCKVRNRPYLDHNGDVDAS
jgi:hypothetical protein